MSRTANPSIPDIVRPASRTRDFEALPDYKQPGVLIFALAVSLLVIVSLLFLAHARVSTYQLGYKIEELTAQHAVLTEESKQLLYEVSRLTTPERLESEAIQKLGLTKMKPEQLRGLKAVRKGKKR
jgi:cell division protein FtsL